MPVSLRGLQENAVDADTCSPAKPDNAGREARRHGVGRISR
jgi:hypothetical protein